MITVNGQGYTYDVNGNLTGNGEKTYIYDIDNRLKEVKNTQGQTIATFTYDHEGKRNSMTQAGTTTHFHYSGDKVVLETDDSNNIIAEYTYDPDGNPATMTRGGETYYYHVNGHGDVTALTDITGNIVARYDYDAYGNILSQTGTMAAINPYRYAGYRYDEATGLYYLMARYYDANIGRFITRDPFHGFLEDSISQNNYVYSKNNPVVFIDSSGYVAIPLILWPVILVLTPVLSYALADITKILYNRATEYKQKYEPTKYLTESRKEHIRKRHFPGYKSNIGKGDLFPSEWIKEESFVWLKAIAIANNKKLPQLQDPGQTNIYRAFPVIYKGYAAIFLVAYRPSGEILTAYPFKGALKVWGK